MEYNMTTDFKIKMTKQIFRRGNILKNTKGLHMIFWMITLRNTQYKFTAAHGTLIGWWLVE